MVKIQRWSGRFLFEVVDQTSLAADWLSARKEAADEVNRKNLDGVISEQQTTVQKMKTQIHKNQQNNLTLLSSLDQPPSWSCSWSMEFFKSFFTAATLTFTAKRFPFLSPNCCHHRVSLFRATEKRNSPGHMIYAHMTTRLHHHLAVKKEGKQKIKLSHSAALQGQRYTRSSVSWSFWLDRIHFCFGHFSVRRRHWRWVYWSVYLLGESNTASES